MCETKVDVLNEGWSARKTAEETVQQGFSYVQEYMRELQKDWWLRRESLVV